MKNCPVCNIQVEDLYTGLCPNSLCSWEFEFISSEMTPELQKRYAEKLAKCRHLYELNIASDKKYDYISHYSEDLAIVILDNKYGVIDRKGRKIVPTIYEYISNFSEGLIAVCLNNKWGFIDKTGKEAIPLIYDDVLDFSEGLVGVKLNNKWGFIDKTGREVTFSIYNDVRNFSEGLACVRWYDKYGFIDKKGKEIIPQIYDYCDGEFRKGKVRVHIEKRYFTIDKNGKRIEDDQ